MKDTWYVTTPIYYVTDDPHVGTAYCTISADFLARWHRLRGERVHFLTGVDEHGPKTAQAAFNAGLEPQAFTDTMAPRFEALWRRLEISNDDFVRTTQPRHKEPAAAFMQALYDAGEIYLGSYEGSYCVRCEEFKTESDLVDGLCPIHKAPVEQLSEPNWFFRLSSYTDRLVAYYDAHPGFVRPQRARNELLGKLRIGLRDQAVSRLTVRWGIPIPWDTSHVIHVWEEALLNYVTAIGYGSPNGLYDRAWPADLHLIGKEIVWFHAVIWPAMLMGAGLPLPRTVFAHGWLLAGGEKISKSGRGITQISPHELIDTYGVDGYRYHFLRATPFGEDGNFSLEDMQARYNADLANDLGNLASRTLAMIERYFGGVVPSDAAAGDPERALDATVARARSGAEALVADLRITEALASIWEIVRHANRYLVEREPWRLARDETKLPLVGAVVATVARALACLAGLLEPAVPIAAAELWSRLGLDGPVTLDPPALEGRRVRAGDALFPRVD